MLLSDSFLCEFANGVSFFTTTSVAYSSNKLASAFFNSVRVNPHCKEDLYVYRVMDLFNSHTTMGYTIDALQMRGGQYVLGLTLNYLHQNFVLCNN